MLATARKVVVMGLVLALTATVLGCGAGVVAPAAAPAVAASEVTSGPQVVKGEIGPGALYELYLPAGWNGDLVLYAHGYCGFAVTQNTAADCLPTSAALRTAILAAGYALGWSSFSDAGMTVKDGAIRTQQLKGLFTANFGTPAHTYLLGESLGAAVVMHLAEANPQNFDGVLVNSGILAGVAFQLDFYSNVRVLFDYFFPGILPPELMPTTQFNAVVAPALLAAMAAHPERVADLAAVNQVGLDHGIPAEIPNAVVTALMFITSDRFTGDIIERTHGRDFFDNRAVRYTGSSDDEALNAGVARFTAHPDTRNMLEQWYEPTGNLKIPVVTLHATRDPVVSILHETAYAERVAAAGNSEMLLQRIYNRAGHMPFTVPEKIAALNDLANWARTGVRPAS